jgi:porin
LVELAFYGEARQITSKRQNLNADVVPMSLSPKRVALVRAFTLMFAVAIASPNYAVASEGEFKVGLDASLEGSVNLGGGTRSGRALHGLALVHADREEPEKSASGLSYAGYVSVLTLVGKGPTERFLGDFLSASNIEGEQSIRLYSWWLEAKRNDWSLRGGVLLADAEFAGTNAGGNFFNSAFGWPAFISANTLNTGPAFYVAAPGLRLEHTWPEAGAWRIGVYDGDAFDSPTGDPTLTRHGLHYKIGGDQGWFVISEATLAPDRGKTRFKIGGWWHTATFADVRDDTAGQPFAISGNNPRTYGSNHGSFAAIEHTLAGDAGQAGKVELFVRAGISPSDRNALSWALDTGLAWTGPLPRRPADIAAVGVAHARFSSRYSSNARLSDPTQPSPDFEEVIEASYAAKISAHCSLQPDVQYIRHPGGSTAQRDCCVFLIRLNASY